ncbi:MAG: hypothetical protein Q4E29_14640 [Lachnospiraceae bacterium]|nr:hypothetical protein [Lachnospiraceae bacterium]
MSDNTKNNSNVNSNSKLDHAPNYTSNHTSDHSSSHNQRNLLLLAVIVLLLLFRVFGNFSEEESSITSDETYVQETYTEDTGTAEVSEETAKESSKEPTGEADGEPDKERTEEEKSEQDDTADLVEAYNEYMQQLQGTQSTQGIQDTRGTQDTTTVRFRNTRLRQEHYEKHGIEMGFTSPEAYEQAAAAVVQNKDALHKLEEEDGDDVYYLESTNEFVIVSTDGYIRTYFYPSNGKDYFDRQ